MFLLQDNPYVLSHFQIVLVSFWDIIISIIKETFILTVTFIIIYEKWDINPRFFRKLRISHPLNCGLLDTNSHIYVLPWEVGFTLYNLCYIYLSIYVSINIIECHKILVEMKLKIIISFVPVFVITSSSQQSNVNYWNV